MTLLQHNTRESPGLSLAYRDEAFKNLIYQLLNAVQCAGERKRFLGDAMVNLGSSRFRRNLMMGVAFAGLAVALVPAGFAQGTPAPAASQASDEKVVVTARKRKESLKEAPVAVTAFTPDSIERLNIQSIDDVARFTPGLSFSKTFGRSSDRPVIRGQSNVLANVLFGVESGTAYFVDGMYYGGSIQSIDMSELQRVEVIKGPQSALFGRNTYAGAINFVTRGVSEELSARGSLRAGSHGTRDARLSLDVPVSDELGIRISGRDYSYDGEYTNVVTNELVGSETTQSLSGVVEWDPSDDLSIRLRASVSRDEDGPLPLFLQSATENNCMPGFRSLAFWPSSGSANQNQYYCGVIKPQKFVNLNTGPRVNPPVLVPGVPLNATLLAANNGNAYSPEDGTAFDGINRDVLLLGGKVNWDVMGSGYNVELDVTHKAEDEKFGTDSDHSGVNVLSSAFVAYNPPIQESLFSNTNRDIIRETSVEFRVSSPTDRPIRWSAGLFAFDGDNKGYDIVKTDLSGKSKFDDHLTIENRAVFGMAEWDITSAVTAILEARYQREEKHLVDFDAPGGPVVFDRTMSVNRVTPRATVRWKASENMMFYGIYSEGMKPGGLNGKPGTDFGKPSYLPETSKNQEIGMKATWLDGRLSTNVAGYHIDAQNVQLTTPVPGAFGAITSIATNQGTGETWGFEGDFRMEIDEHFSFGGSYSWTNPKFVEGCDEDQWTLTSGGGRLGIGVNTAPGTGTAQAGFTGNCSIAGKRYPMVPMHQASLSGEYRSDVLFSAMNNDFRLVAQADMTYESSKFVQVHNLAETGSTFLLGSRLGVEGENWSFGLYGRNLTDEDSVTLCTRWLTIPYGVGPGYVAGNTAPALLPNPPGVSRSSPRSFFCGLRPGMSAGLELSFKY